MAKKLSKKRIYVIHYHPIEQYPPILNLLNIICRDYSDDLVTVITSHGTLGVFKAPNTNVRIIRCGKSDPKASAFYRYLSYLIFYFKASIGLLAGGPSKILYFEALSYLPVWVYQSLHKCDLFCHYHEYVSPEEYKTGMLLNRIAHKLEQSRYQTFSWISHTNEQRMDLFLKDNPDVPANITFILPNYPPKEWYCFPQKTEVNKILKVVYVGAISLESLYIREFAGWIESQNGLVVWDLYSNQDHTSLLHFLDQISARHIRFCGAVNYFQLPFILKNYDVGVILYKGHSLNYIYNAPNKLFEYWALGLEVWYPSVMEGIKPFLNSEAGRLREVDFENLSYFSMPVFDRTRFIVKNRAPFSAEVALGKLNDKLFS